MSVETVVKCATPTIGEGPHWDNATQSLLWIDMIDGILFKWNSRTKTYETHEFGVFCSFVVPCRKGGYLLGLGRTLSHFDWDNKKIIKLAEVEHDKNNQINEAKCDASGRLWFGTMAVERAPFDLELHQGALYSFELDGTIKKHKDRITMSNGLAWSADNKTMYFIDTMLRKVWAYDFDLTPGTISNERVVVDFDSDETLKKYGYPDGMTIDTEDKIWVACYGAGKVIRFDPQRGKELQTINIPAKEITSCCWGGKNLDEMYITSARNMMTEEDKIETPLAGSVFKVSALGYKGLPAYVYEEKSEMSVETVVKYATPTIGEGPHWDDATQSLLWVDIIDGILFKWDSKTHKHETHKFDISCSFVVPCRKGGYLVGLGRTVSHFDWDSKKITKLAEVEHGKNIRMNDAKCDATGRLWCGTMAIERFPGDYRNFEFHQGALYSFEADGTIRKHKDKVSISNGLAWTKDNKTMYYIDSTPRKILAYDFDLSSGTMTNERTVVDFGNEDTLTKYEFPDGMTVDSDDKIWVASYGGGQVIRFDPHTGYAVIIRGPRNKNGWTYNVKNLECPDSVRCVEMLLPILVTSASGGKALQTIKIPAKRTTSCCWGGKNLDELFVTNARFGMTEEEKTESPLAGSIFKVSGLGFNGIPAYVYDG